MMRILKDEPKPSDIYWQNKLSASAALMAAGLLLAAMISLIASSLKFGASEISVTFFEDNWLVLLFKINAGYEGVPFDRLQGVYFLDVAILVLTGVSYAGFVAFVQRPGKVWTIVATALPFLGIVLLIVTRLVGRSAVMGGGLILGGVMLRFKVFDKGLALAGVIANILLLIGDFGTNPTSASTVFAIFIAAGYLLLTAWFFLIARKLYQIR